MEDTIVAYILQNILRQDMIRDIVERQKEFFRSGKTLPVEYRKDIACRIQDTDLKGFEGSHSQDGA